MRDLELFSKLRKLVSVEDPRFQAAAEAHRAIEKSREKSQFQVARQFLREFREDEGVQRKPMYNVASLESKRDLGA